MALTAVLMVLRRRDFFQDFASQKHPPMVLMEVLVTGVLPEGSVSAVAPVLEVLVNTVALLLLEGSVSMAAPVLEGSVSMEQLAGAAPTGPGQD